MVGVGGRVGGAVVRLLVWSVGLECECLTIGGLFGNRCWCVLVCGLMVCWSWWWCGVGVWWLYVCAVVGGIG